MSLISKVASIISTSSNIDDVVYLKDRIQYDDDLRTLDIDLKSIIPAPPKNSSSTTTRELVQTSQSNFISYKC
jgi:nucleoside phosphorylase